MNWFKNLEPKQQKVIAGILLGIGIVCVAVGFITYWFFIPAIFFLFGGIFLFSKIDKAKESDIDNSDSDNKNFENSKSLNYKNKFESCTQDLELHKYKELISNNFQINDDTSNFDCSLMIMALNQIMENKNFNPNDLDFDVLEKIKQLENFGHQKFLQSKCKDFICVDTETTGLDPLNDRIIQLSAVKVINGEIIDVYTKTINPKKHIAAKASEKNGIYDSDVKGCPTIDKILPEFINFIGKYTLVMHNEKFDLSFLKQESLRVFGKNCIQNKHLCTMKLWKALFLEKQDENSPSTTLSTLVTNLLSKDQQREYFANQHTATADAIATARVFMKIYSD